VYAYSATGIPTSVTSTLAGVTDARAFKQTGNQLVAGTHQETFDSIGRAVDVDGVAITYGANGQIASASHAGKAWTYVYDEAGQRVAKLVAGEITAAYLPDGSTIDGAGRSEPVKFAGLTVGTLRHPFGGGAKAFSLVALDGRGTSFSDAQGAEHAGSPFGDRAVHPDVAGTLDFAASRYDADLGLVRMGLRDYDAHMSRFTTPDPLLAEDLTKCVGHAADCTLYAYSRNNPLLVVDPSGQFGIAIGFGASAVAGGGGEGAGASGESGIFIDISNFAIIPYISTGTAGNPQSFVLGGSAGVGYAATVIFDSDAFAGKGESISVATPTPWGGTVPLTEDGHVNGIGVTFGKGVGASAAILQTNTLTDSQQQPYQYAPAQEQQPAPESTTGAYNSEDE
jgi:RHS repeat-associated protein